MNPFPVVGPLDSNYIPTQLQVDETRTWLLQVQRKISHLDNDITDLLHRAEVAKETKQKLERIAKSYACFVSPLRKVPTEIWNDIFHLVVSETMHINYYSGCMIRHATWLKGVCRRWDDIIDSSPRLWSYACVKIESPADCKRQEQYLRLAQGASLYWHLFFPEVPRYPVYSSDYSEIVEPEFISDEETDVDELERLTELIERNIQSLFTTYGSQCHELYLTDVGGHWTYLLRSIPGAERLKRLCISTGNMDDEKASLLQQFITSTKFPRLCHVSLFPACMPEIEISHPPSHPISSHISSLHLDSMELDSIYTVLASCPSVGSVTMKPIPCSFIPEVICNLSSLIIIGENDSWLAPFFNLTLPRLSTLEIIDCYPRDMHAAPCRDLEDEFVDFFSRSRCSLTSITMTNVLITEDPLLDIFRLTPGLTSLILKGQHNSMTDKVLRSLLYDPTSTEVLLLPGLIEMEVTVCIQQLDLILGVIESRRPSDPGPSSASTTQCLARALITACHCHCLNSDLEILVPDSIAQRVDKLRQSGLRMAIIPPTRYAGSPRAGRTRP